MVAQTKGIGEINLNEVEDLDGISVLRGGGSTRGWNGIQYQQGLSGKIEERLFPAAHARGSTTGDDGGNDPHA